MKKWMVVFTVLIICLLVILPACGEKTNEPTSITTSTPALTATSSVTPIPTGTVTATPTPTTSEPVKIGVINAWSGPMAVSGQLADQIIAVVQQQVKDMGGILGGRQVEFVKGDNAGVTAQAGAQADKLALEEKLDMLCFGGTNGASYQAVAQEAESLKVPYIAPATIYGGATMKYNISIYTTSVLIGRVADFPIEFVKPKTIAWLSYDDENARNFLKGVEDVTGASERWKNAGIDLLYEQYFPQDTMDFSPYLTKIRYLKSDLAIISANSIPQAITINKQIMEQGGWGDIKVFNCNSTSSNQKVITMPAALGNYTSVEWLAGSDEPGMKAFEDAYNKMYGKLPSPELAYYYNNFWTGIKAMELAGTSDRDKVAQAMRSGNLEWDSAWGPLHIPPDGKGAPSLMVAQVQEGGKLVKVWSQ
jgi:ABC-type branched-subunit amino acid transport system substrate-binding protein